MRLQYPPMFSPTPAVSQNNTRFEKKAQMIQEETHP